CLQISLIRHINLILPVPLLSLNDPATTEIYTLSLHDALPIYLWKRTAERSPSTASRGRAAPLRSLCRDSPFLDNFLRTSRKDPEDRKSTRLNSSHVKISYAVFCLKKKR